MPDEVVDRVHQKARQQKADPGLLFGDWNMNDAEDESVDSDSSDDDGDFTPSQDDHDEESEYDDDGARLDYDEEGDSGASVPEMSTDGETQVSLGDGAPGMESRWIANNRHITAPEMEDDEHPGIMDWEIEGVGDDGYDA